MSSPAFNTRAAVYKAALLEEDQYWDTFCQNQRVKEELNFQAPASHTRAKIRSYARQRKRLLRKNGTIYVKQKLRHFIKRPRIKVVTKEASIYLNAALKALTYDIIFVAGEFAKRYTFFL